MRELLLGLATLEGLPHGTGQERFQRALLRCKAEMAFDIFSSAEGQMAASDIASLLRAVECHELGPHHEPDQQMLMLRSQALVGGRSIGKPEFVSRALQGSCSAHIPDFLRLGAQVKLWAS